jgi:cyclic pyranopterin monophosphate synthase
LESSLESVLFPFEEAGADLLTLPIAARRALDHAGHRLSLQGWRSLPLEERRAIAVAGGAESVDTGFVSASLRRADPRPHRIEAPSDPDSLVPPEVLSAALAPDRSIDPRRWARLRALDRYALAHEHRRSVARDDRSRVIRACDAILPSVVLDRGGDGRGAQASPSSRPPRALLSPLPEPPDPSPGRYSEAPRAPENTGTPGRSRETPNPVAGMDTAASPVIPPLAPPPAIPLQGGPAVSTHIDARGNVHMVDVRSKEPTHRRAVASGAVRMRPETADRILRGDAAKGEVLATARLAGIMAAKRTPDLIPLCHGVQLTRVAVQIDLDPHVGVALVTATAEAFDRTGVEMEAMVAASVACLTIYDMLKGVDRDMTIVDVKLLEKTGGRSGAYRREGSR